MLEKFCAALDTTLERYIKVEQRWFLEKDKYMSERGQMDQKALVLENEGWKKYLILQTSKDIDNIRINT